MAASTLSLPVPVSSRPARESGIRSMPRAVHVMAPRAHTGVKLRHREEAELAFRQLTRQQGDALEAIAHAIEYLVDNGLPHRLRFDNTMLSDGEAIAILQRAGRGVLTQASARQSWWRRFFGFIPDVTSAVG